MKQITIEGIVYNVHPEKPKGGDLILIKNTYPNSKMYNVIRKCDSIKIYDGKEHCSIETTDLTIRYYPMTMCEKVTVEAEKKCIWCLFSVANEYNQPMHNLEGWWSEQPEPFKLKEVCQCTIPEAKELIKFGQANLDHIRYTLQLVGEGKI